MKYIKLYKTQEEAIGDTLETPAFIMQEDENTIIPVPSSLGEKVKIIKNTLKDTIIAVEKFTSKTIIKLSANGDGQIVVNQGYYNVDGFNDSYPDFYIRMDSSNDREIDSTKYYSYETQYGYIFYLTVDLSDYSKDDTVDCTIYYDNQGECDGSFDDTITVTKYDPSYSGPLQQTLNYSEGDNQEIEVEGEVLSMAAVRVDNENTTLTAIEIPNNITNIGNYAFYGCTSLTSVIIPNSVTSIGDIAFLNCTSLTSVNIPNSVTSIGNQAFSFCTGLTSITIPNSVTSIGDSAFIGTGLTSITIPSSVTSIGTYAFYGCTGLTSITCEAVTPPTYGTSCIPNNVTVIYVPLESVDAYKTASGWSTYASIIQAIQE